mmetsp:Transcript_68133/g.193040  ORF Transcript_68133/g.193040 Transcript_68133/m.193040 type:complete len:329 (+) Transcript_68133:56-1042(+)
MPCFAPILVGIALLAVPARSLRSPGKVNNQLPPDCAVARYRAGDSWLAAAVKGEHRAAPAQPVASRMPTLNLMVCQSALSLKQLALLRKAWIDEALTVPGIQVRVFVPSTIAKSLTFTDPQLGVTALSEWHGDVASFQTAMSNALVACEREGPAARFYAVMDDDMVVKPRALMNWALKQQSVADMETGGFGLWGHEGCCDLVYGGMMLMTRHLVEWIVGDMPYFRALAVEKMLHHANHSLMGIYNGTPYNIDHFFPVATAMLGGVRAVRGTKIIQDQIWDNAKLCPWPQDVLVVHHVGPSDFEDFNRRTAPGGEGCGQGWPAAKATSG